MNLHIREDSLLRKYYQIARRSVNFYFNVKRDVVYLPFHIFQYMWCCLLFNNRLIIATSFYV